MPIPAAELEQLLPLLSVRHAMSDILAQLVPDQCLALPPLPNDPATIAACDVLAQHYLQSGQCQPIPDSAFSVPKWVFLEYAVRNYGMLLHGSPDPSITQFVPRVAQDNLVGGDQPRVYAASSGILAGFYAIIDRARLDTLPLVPALFNLYLARPLADGQLDQRFIFALDYRALPAHPWHTGTVYLLPAAGFVADHQQEQWWSSEPVVPRATCTLSPNEWPLLDQVRGVEFIHLLSRMNQSLEGLPWWPDPLIYPTSTPSV